MIYSLGTIISAAVIITYITKISKKKKKKVRDIVHMLASFPVRGREEKKKKNKSLINVCCVVDDFVATFVANGLCMRNNGLRAEREMA